MKAGKTTENQDARGRTDTLAKAYEVLRRYTLIPEGDLSIDALVSGLLFCV